jgi:hypothetical protein
VTASPCGIAFVLAVALVPAIAAAQPPADLAIPEVEVRVYISAPLSTSTKRQMLTTADGILRAAGVSTRWHECAIPKTDPQCGVAAGTGVIILRYVAGHAVPAAICGQAVHGPHRATGIVTVFRGCVSDLVQAFSDHTNATVRMRVTAGHVIGLLLVHEVGHLLGQAHAAAGIMRAVLTAAEWQQLAAERLFFSGAEAMTLRSGALSVSKHQRAPAPRSYALTASATD